MLSYIFHYKVKSKGLVIIIQGKTLKYSTHTWFLHRELQRLIWGRGPRMHREWWGKEANFYEVDHEIDSPEELDGFLLCPSLSKLNAWSIFENKIIISVIIGVSLVHSSGTPIFQPIPRAGVMQCTFCTAFLVDLVHFYIYWVFTSIPWRITFEK